jgi:hypothetical protein
MTMTSMFAALPLDQLEEASGELHRRAASALRRIGEGRADDPDADGMSPRRRIAALAASTELACVTLAALGAGEAVPPSRSDRLPSAIAAVMYGAPTIDGLLVRVEQDRRMLASLARQLESRLDEPASTAWGDGGARRLLVELAIAAPAHCAQALETVVAALEEAARAAAEES